jgi:two-component system chemotaxis response regulator CheB
VSRRDGPDSGGGSLRFRCHTGHAYTSAALLSELRESVEATLWSAARVLDEHEMLLEHLAKHLTEAGNPAQGETLRRESAQVRARSRTVRGVAVQSGGHPHERLYAVHGAGLLDETREHPA